MSRNHSFSPREQAILDQVRINAPAMMMKTGLIDAFIAWRAHPEIGLDARALDELTNEDYDWLRQCFETTGLKPTIHGPFLDLAPAALDPMILDLSRKRYHQALEIAGQLRAEHIVFHPSFDYKRHHFYYREWLDINEQTWTPLARRAEELNVRLVLENTYETQPDDLRPLLERLQPYGVGFCFDIGHAQAFGRVPLLDWLETNGKYLAALHLHDNHGDRDEHLAIGRGSINFQLFFSWLVEHDIRPPVITLEPHREEDLVPALTALAALWPWPL
jgi:sugar phosphate isomerase/epimerase